MPPVKPRGARVSSFRLGRKGVARALKVFGGFWALGFGSSLGYRYGLGVSGSAVSEGFRGARP